jgi:Brp/Blh family beta-carotene 15,15'-monooxygenase
LIWGFAIYFIIWHSIPSIINQINYLNGEVSWNNFRKYIRSAFLYWVISLIGIATLYLLFKDIEIFNALFFSFLAAITFPHVLVIFILFKKK